MDTFTFDWDDANIGHIAEYDVTPEEAEQVLNHEPFEVDYQNWGGEPRIRHMGETSTGRILTVVSTYRQGRVRVVAAFPSNRRQRIDYLQQRGREEQ